MQLDKELESLTTQDKASGRCTCGITISTNKPEQFDSLITIARSSYRYWAYIIHDKDTNTDGTLKSPHLHLVCWNITPTSLKSHCELFKSVIDSNFICKIKSIRGVCRYLTHIDYPSKYQYSIDNVKTNNIAWYSDFFRINDPNQEFADYNDVCAGKMTIDEFIKKYSSDISRLNIYQKINLYNNIKKGIRFYEK